MKHININNAIDALLETKFSSDNYLSETAKVLNLQDESSITFAKKLGVYGGEFTERELSEIGKILSIPPEVLKLFELKEDHTTGTKIMFLRNALLGILRMYVEKQEEVKRVA